MASATNLGNLFVTLNARTLQYTRAMNSASRTTEVTMRQINKAIKFGTAAAVASFALIGAASVRAFSQFESSFAGVEKTVDASRAELDRLALSFRRMATEIPVSVNEINRVAEAAGQLGIATGNIEGFTRTMLELGVATNLTAEEAATSLARLANITGLPQTEFAKLGSAIVALGNNFATTEAEIVGMTLRLAGAANIVGFTESQMLALATAMSSVGVRAEEGGTAMSKVLLEMNSAVKGMTAELAVFARVAGLSVSEFAELFEQDALTAVNLFVEGLGQINASGGDVSGALEEVNLQGIRVTSTLLKLAGAEGLLTKAIDLANTAYTENSALTEEVEKRYATFESKVTLLLNSLNDMLITIGAELVPVLTALMSIMAMNDKEAEDFNDTLQAFASFLKGTLIVTIGVVGDILFGMIATFKLLQLGILQFERGFTGIAFIAEIVFKAIDAALSEMVNLWKINFEGLKLVVFAVFDGIIKLADKALTPVINGINSLITSLNDLTGTDFGTIDFKFNSVGFEKEMLQSANAIMKLSEAENQLATDTVNSAKKFGQFLEDTANGTGFYSEKIKELKEELTEMAEKGTPSTRLIEELARVELEAAKEAANSAEEHRLLAESLNEVSAAAVKTVTAQTEVIKITAKMREEAEALQESIKTPFEKGIESLQRYDQLLKAGLITQQQFNRATAQAFGTTTGELGLPQDGMEGGEGAGGFSTGAFGGGALGGFAMGGGEGDKLAEFQLEEQQLQLHMQKLEEIRLAGEESMAAGQLEIITALQEQTQQKLADNITAQNELIFGSIQETSEQLLGFLKQTAGEQSGIYKTMFAVSKAFAIADSIVKIQQGIANAFSLPFPANIAAAISVASQAAGIISTIQGTVANFEGGGMTPSGPRSGGVDGRGGFMAVLHPDEKITDLKRGKSKVDNDREIELVVNITNMMSGEATVTAEKSDDGQRLDIIVKRTEKEIANNIRVGRGPVGSAIGETFNVSRGRQ